MTSWVIFGIKISDIKRLFAVNEKNTLCGSVRYILHLGWQSKKAALLNANISKAVSLDSHASFDDFNHTIIRMPMHRNSVISWKFSIEVIMPFRWVAIDCC